MLLPKELGNLFEKNIFPQIFRMWSFRAKKKLRGKTTGKQARLRYVMSSVGLDCSVLGYDWASWSKGGGGVAFELVELWKLEMGGIELTSVIVEPQGGPVASRVSSRRSPCLYLLPLLFYVS